MSIPGAESDTHTSPSLWITTNIPFGANQLFELQLTELAITDADGTVAGADWFTDSGWELYLAETGFERPFGELDIRRDTLRTDGIGGQQITWFQVSQFNIANLGLDLVDDVPIPAIVSQSFAELNNLDIGLTFPLTINQQDLTFEITDIIDYFPTLYQERPFIITDFRTLSNRIRAQSSAEIFPNETWLNLRDGVSDLEFLQQLQLDNPERGLINASVYSTELNTFATDPLSLGLIGLLYISFLVVLILSVISLLTYAALTAQARRNEFGVLQAMGLSSSRLTYSPSIRTGHRCWHIGRAWCHPWCRVEQSSITNTCQQHLNTDHCTTVFGTNSGVVNHPIRSIHRGNADICVGCQPDSCSALIVITSIAIGRRINHAI